MMISIPDHSLHSFPTTGNCGLRRILIVRLGAMGDVIHGLPVAAALRRLFSEIEIGWVVERRWIDLLGSPVVEPGSATDAGQESLPRERFARQPLVDRIHVADTFAWRKKPLARSTRRAFCALVSELRRTKYDAAIDLQGSWKSALLTGLSGAPLKVGFHQPRESGASAFYNRKVAASGRHVIEQNLSLLAGLSGLLGNAASAESTEFFVSSPRAVLPERVEDASWLETELGRRGLAGRHFAVINPGAGWGAKCWPAERYAEVARALAELGLFSLINYGPAEEALARTVEAAASGTALGISCTISQLTAIMRKARLFVGGDTGPMHLAAALCVPVVALFGPTDPARNGPYAARSVVLRHASSVTDHSRHAAAEPGLLAISTEQVVAAAHQLLGDNAEACKEETVV